MDMIRARYTGALMAHAIALMWRLTIGTWFDGWMELTSDMARGHLTIEAPHKYMRRLYNTLISIYAPVLSMLKWKSTHRRSMERVIKTKNTIKEKERIVNVISIFSKQSDLLLSQL